MNQSSEYNFYKAKKNFKDNTLVTLPTKQEWCDNNNELIANFRCKYLIKQIKIKLITSRIALSI